MMFDDHTPRKLLGYATECPKCGTELLYAIPPSDPKGVLGQCPAVACGMAGMNIMAPIYETEDEE